MRGLLFSTGLLIFAARLRRSPWGLTGLENAASQALLIFAACQECSPLGAHSVLMRG